MKHTRIILLGALAGTAAFAQTVGTLNISGSIPDAVSITSVTDTALSSTSVLGALIATKQLDANADHSGRHPHTQQQTIQAQRYFGLYELRSRRR